MPESCISSITRDASRISSRLTRPSAFARWPMTENVAVKNAVWVRSRGSRKSPASSASRNSVSAHPRPRPDRAERSKLWPSATPTSAPIGPPSVPPGIFPSQLIAFSGASVRVPMHRDYIGSRRLGHRAPRYRWRTEVGGGSRAVCRIHADRETSPVGHRRRLESKGASTRPCAAFVPPSQVVPRLAVGERAGGRAGQSTDPARDASGRRPIFPDTEEGLNRTGSTSRREAPNFRSTMCHTFAGFRFAVFLRLGVEGAQVHGREHGRAGTCP